MSGHDPERAYVAAMLGDQAAKLADYRASVRAELDSLRKSLMTTAEQQQVDGHEQRLRRMVEDRKAAVARIINGDAEAAPLDPQDQAGASTAGRNAPASSGPGPGQLNNPHAAMLAEAERARAIADMPMSEYAARRAELGVESPTSMNRLFSQEAR